MLFIQKHKYLLLVLVFIVATLGIIIYRPYLADLLYKFPESGSFTVGERTLIIAPHPDDETLGGAGVIEKSLAAGKQIKVVVITCGDGFKRAVIENFGVTSPGPDDFRKLGTARHLESIKAVATLGLNPKDIIFLGYPDGGTNSLWEKNWDYGNPHVGYNGSKVSPYPFIYQVDAPNCGINVIKNLKEIIDNFQPTDIVYPDPNDQHPDHWAANAFIKYILADGNYNIKEWNYLVHRGDYPFPWKYDPNLLLKPPLALKNAAGANWVYLSMNAEERQRKLAAVEEYRTQTKVMNPFLEAFVRRNDLLSFYPELNLGSAKAGAESKTEVQTLIHDAQGDTIQREISPSGDIATLGFKLTKQDFAVRLSTHGNISPKVHYDIRFRLFTPEEVRRYDLTINNGHLTAHKYAGNSLTLPNSTKPIIKANELLIRLPGKDFVGVTKFLVSADTIAHREQIDKSPWRLVEIK